MIHAEITVGSSDGPGGRRQEPRVEATADVSIRKLGTFGSDARLINLSSHGFMAETHAAIEPGARVWLSLPGALRANALVLWAHGGRLGGAFAEPIDTLAVLHAIGMRAGAFEAGSAAS